MLERRYSRNRFMRTGLLAVVLAFLAGGVAESIAHPAAPVIPVQAETADEGRQPDGDAPRHNELSCAVCQVLGGLAVPASITSPVTSWQRPLRAARAAPISFSRSTPRTIRARGPPPA